MLPLGVPEVGLMTLRTEEGHLLSSGLPGGGNAIQFISPLPALVVPHSLVISKLLWALAAFSRFETSLVDHDNFWSVHSSDTQLFDGRDGDETCLDVPPSVVLSLLMPAVWCWSRDEGSLLRRNDIPAAQLLLEAFSITYDGLSKC